MTEVQDIALTIASVALDPDELALAVRRNVQMNFAAQTLCRFYGPQDGCHCRGNDANCHAYKLWADEARAFVLAFERAGWLKESEPINETAG